MICCTLVQETEAVMPCIQLQTGHSVGHVREPVNCIVLSEIEMQNRIVTGRSTKRIRFKSQMSFQPGDQFELLPLQSPSLVARVAKLMNWNLDDVFEAPSAMDTSLLSIKGLCSLREALTQYADLTGPPHKSLLVHIGKLLSKDNPHLGQELLDLAITRTHTKYYKRFRTLVEFLESIPNVSKLLSFHDFLSHVMCFTPRRYSISNAPGTDQIELIVSLSVDQDFQKEYVGLASAFLGSLQPNDSFWGRVKHNSSRLDIQSPIIFVATGSGLAPIFGYLEAESKRENPHPILLFFGCRDENDDLSLTLNYPFVTIHKAYSGGTLKKHVQDVIGESDQVLPFIASGCHVYFCGHALMARDVQGILKDKLLSNGSSEAQACHFVQNFTSIDS